MNKKTIGIARLAPMYLLENNFNAKGLSAQFIKGFLKLFSDQYNLKICTSMNPEDEKIFTNAILLKKNPYLEAIDYNPDPDSSNLDSIVIFPSEVDEDQESYVNDVRELLKDFEGTVYYMQYNDVLFPLLSELDLTKINFVVLANTDKSISFIFNDDMYGKDYDIDGLSLDMNSLIYNNRTSRDKQYYIKISLMADKFKEEHKKLTVKHSNLFFIGPMDENEYYPGYEYDDFTTYQGLVYQFKHTTIVYIDNMYKYLYNPYFIEASNYTLPVIINENIRIPAQFKLDYVTWDNSKDKYKEFILHKGNSKLLKQLRAAISAEYKNSTLSEDLNKIFKSNF